MQKWIKNRYLKVSMKYLNHTLSEAQSYFITSVLRIKEKRYLQNDLCTLAGFHLECPPSNYWDFLPSHMCTIDIQPWIHGYRQETERIPWFSCSLRKSYICCIVIYELRMKYTWIHRDSARWAIFYPERYFGHSLGGFVLSLSRK